MSAYKIDLGFTKLQKALISLELMAKKPMQKDRSNVDACIQRFEFTIELFWKLLKAILESNGVETQYPREVLKEAYRGHLINHEEQWLQMLIDRNLTSHTYEEKLADIIYKRIKEYVPIFRSTFDSLLKSYGPKKPS
jgi:nucleotidyltransferase substrate binding protein (TIGR01987 family)